MTWPDAQQYVTWLSSKTGHDYRLPSESEWEYAARAGTTGRFNTGDCITAEQANFNAGRPAQGCERGAYPEQTLPVRSFAPNAFGLYDTHGNVLEWDQDCWNPNYFEHFGFPSSSDGHEDQIKFGPTRRGVADVAGSQLHLPIDWHPGRSLCA